MLGTQQSTNPLTMTMWGVGGLTQSDPTDLWSLKRGAENQPPTGVTQVKVKRTDELNSQFISSFSMPQKTSY